MRLNCSLGVALCALAVAGPAALPAAAADLQQGEAIARRWCAPCHAVAPDQRQPTGEATPFSELARLPDLDAARVAFYLLLPHPRMPDMSLTRAEAANLAAFISAQRR